MFIDESGCRSGITSCFQTNPGSIYIIIMVAFAFPGIVEDTSVQCAFGIVIAVHHLEWWYRVPSDTHLLLSPLVRNNSTLNSDCYISAVLRSVALPFIWAMRKANFPQINAQQNVADIFRSFLIQKIENVLLMVAERLVRHYTSYTTEDELSHNVEAACAAVPVNTIESLYDIIPCA